MSEQKPDHAAVLEELDHVSIWQRAACRAGAEAIRTLEAVQELSWEWDQAYPSSIFIEPPPGEHGKTVDSCSAAMARHMANALARALGKPEAYTDDEGDE